MPFRGLVAANLDRTSRRFARALDEFRQRNCVRLAAEPLHEGIARALQTGGIRRLLGRQVPGAVIRRATAGNLATEALPLVSRVLSGHINARIDSETTHSAGVEVSTDSFQRKEAEVNEDTWSSVDHIVQHSTI